MKKLLLTALLMTACMPSPEDINSSDIDQYVSDAGHLSVAEEQPKTEVACDLDCLPPEQDGNMLCSYRKFNQTSRYDQFVALQPNSATLWPGNVVSGRGASLGLLTPLGLRLAPVTFSISLEGMRGKVGGTLNEPNLLTFRQLRNDILNDGVKGSTPAAIDLQISEVHSLSQVGVKLGAGVNWPGGGKVAGSFDFSSSNKKTKILVDFTQAYYTIDINAPLRPSDFFLKVVKSEDVERVVEKGNPPVYIQSITYGRRVIFAIETDEDEQTIEAAIKATYGAKAADVDAQVSLQHKSSLDKSTIHAFILGGSGEDAVGAVAGFDGVVEYIKNGGNYSKDSPGAPISYKLAYLDNEVTQLAFTTDYAEKTCTRNRGSLRFNLESITQTGGDIVKLYGVLSILVPTGDNDMVACGGGDQIDIFSLTQNQYQTIPKGGTWRPSLPMEETVPNARLGKGTEICVMGNLWNSHMDEWFPPPDEEFVEVVKTFYYENSWNGLRTVHFQGNGELGIDVTFKVSELE
jgi:thiol-activated cytolysin